MITMRSFRYALLLMSLFIFSKEKISAQDKPAPLPLMTPPSPNAAALGEYGKVPVGLFTGTVQQNIPLYTIETGDFSMPISLNYQSNGIKVCDVGSNVGLGWVLDAGGVITRTVNDETDEYGGYTKTTLPNAEFTSQQMTDYLKQVTSNNNLDSELDIFAFNFAGYSGKFYLSGTAPNMSAVLISPAPLKIAFNSNFYTDNLTTEQIVITDAAGIEYTFGGTNAIERSNSQTYGSGNAADNPPSKLVKTAWQLTKIKLLNGELITFTYTGKLLNYDAGISQTLPAALSYTPFANDYHFQYAVHGLPKITAMNVQSSRMAEINWKSGKLTIAYSPRFTGGTTSLDKVDNLTISTKNGSTFTVLKKYAFNYLVTNGLFPNPDNLNGNYLDANKRLFLSDVITQSPANTELNRYKFEYYSPDQLPGRFSYAQDYWGYFNGKTNNPDLVTKNAFFSNPEYYQATADFSDERPKHLFNYVGGDKSPDWQYGVKGMLQKVTYPTGGHSSFEYESHSTGKFEDVPPAKTYVILQGSKPAGTNEPLTHTTPIISFEQSRVELFPSMSANGCIHSPQSVDYKITIKDLQTNTNIWIEEYNQGYYYGKLTPYAVAYNDLYPGNGQPPLKRYFFTFHPGKSYEFKISVNAPTCADADVELRFSYYGQAMTNQWVNTPVGGVRLSKITTADLTGNQQIKRYYYGSDFNTLTRSTGKARIVEPSMSYFESITNNASNHELRVLNVNLNSFPLHDLYNAQGYHISYGTVIETEGNNMEGGATIHNFRMAEEIPPYHYRDPVMGTPFENTFGNGEEIQTRIYKNVGTMVKVKEINNTYVNDNRITSSVPAFKATKRTTNYLNFAETHNLSTYSIKSQWRYLSATSETTFDAGGANGLTVWNNYTYGSQTHMQLTASTTTFENAGLSSQRALYTKTAYPSDYTYPGTVSGPAAVMKNMANKHIWNVPIEKLQYTMIGSGTTFRLNSGDVSTFKLNGSLITKDKDFTLKQNNSTIYHDLISLTASTVNSSGQFVYDSRYEQLNSYNRYDSVNNLLEVSDRKFTSGAIVQPHTEALWARVDNASYTSFAYSSFEHDASIPSRFTNWNYNVANINTSNYRSGARAYSLSGANITTTQTLTSSQKYKVSLWRKIGSGTTLTLTAGSTLTQVPGAQRNGWQYIEATFTGATSLTISGNYIIDELRLCPVNARMTTYVYKDGVGTTSQCNENNQHTFFEYDEFNRLKLVKDQDGNILKKNEYKYQHIQN